MISAAKPNVSGSEQELGLLEVERELVLLRDMIKPYFGEDPPSGKVWQVLQGLLRRETVLTRRLAEVRRALT